MRRADTGSFRRRGPAADPRGELMAAADAELGERVSEVVLDRLRAQVQLGGGLPIGEPRRDQAHYPQFLRGKAR